MGALVIHHLLSLSDLEPEGRFDKWGSKSETVL